MILIFNLFGCKKTSYLVDGGLASAKTSYTTYDYLEHNQYKIFDTVLLLIDHFGLKDSVNKAGTFFAPTNYNVRHVMNTLGLDSLDQLYKVINSKCLTQFMFSDTSISLYSASTSTKEIKNWAGTVCGYKKTAYTYSNLTTYTYYILQYVQINGALDGSSDASSDDQTDAVLNCQTTGVKTSSGTTLHVLANSGSFKTSF